VFLYLPDHFKAIFLGIIEGLTEFIPVSSTAHLILASKLINFSSIKNNLFEIVIQLGAILAVVVLYRKDLFKKDRFFFLKVALAFIPAAICGFLFHSFIKQFLFSEIVIAIALIVGGIIIVLIENKNPSSNREIGFKLAFLIGIFQCVAMIPGVSRSGATIIGAIFLGANRKSATEFSFFLAIPTIFAASFYDLITNYDQVSSSDLSLIFTGFASSFISSIFIIKWFILYVSRNSFKPFAIYRIALGTAMIIYQI
jgi:undecaprenyl-diphosphatase